MRSASEAAPSSTSVRAAPACRFFSNHVTPVSPAAAERVEIGAADHAAVRAERDRLHDVAAPPHAAVADDRDGVADGVDHRRDEFDGRRRAVELAAAVVRQGDAVDAVLDREHRVVDGLDALDHDADRSSWPGTTRCRPTTMTDRTAPST